MIHDNDQSCQALLIGFYLYIITAHFARTPYEQNINNWQPDLQRVTRGDADCRPVNHRRHRALPSTIRQHGWLRPNFAAAPSHDKSREFGRRPRAAGRYHRNAAAAISTVCKSAPYRRRISPLTARAADRGDLRMAGRQRRVTIYDVIGVRSRPGDAAGPSGRNYGLGTALQQVVGAGGPHGAPLLSRIGGDVGPAAKCDLMRRPRRTAPRPGWRRHGPWQPAVRARKQATAGVCL